MSNEVKDRIEASMTGREKWLVWPTIRVHLDQFEGYRLIKDRPGCNGWYCQCCGKPQPGRVKVAIWRDLETGKDKYLCKSCFDKQCPEPTKADAIYGAARGGGKQVIPDYPKPDKKLEFACPDGTVADAEFLNKLYLWWMELGKPYLSPKPTEPAAKPAEPKAWTVPPEYQAKLEACERVVLNTPIRKSKPAAKPAERLYSFGVAEPEPWAELKLVARHESYNPHQMAYRFEEAWHEQERRVSRMIDKAIKAERELLAGLLEHAGLRITSDILRSYRDAE